MRHKPVFKPFFFSLLLLILVLSGGAALAQDASNYVIATHYPAFGGTDPAPRRELNPSYTVYSNQENDYKAVTRERAEAVLAQVVAETGLDRAINLNDWADVQEHVDALQIVNNVPIEGALYTIFLPPGWHRGAALPIVLSGNGAGTSNNDRFWDGEIEAAQIAALGAGAGRTGIIVAISNCGGTESQGVDEGTYRSVGAFFDFMDANGGDKYNAITAGGSRGGGSALMWAINPLGLDYEVHTVLAAVPPTHYGSLSQVSPLTYPSMGSIGTLVSQDDNAWNYHNDGPHPGMNPSPYMEILIGTGVPEEANAISPIGLAEGLVGKQVLLSFGAHDSFFPLSPFLEFDRRLTALGVHHASQITLASGHESTDFFFETIFLYFNGLALGLPPTLPTGRFIFIDADPAVGDEISLAGFLSSRGIEGDASGLPVIAQFPYRAGLGNPVNVEVCGTAGDEVVLAMLDDSGAVAYELSGTIDETECLTSMIVLGVSPSEVCEDDFSLSADAGDGDAQDDAGGNAADALTDSLENTGIGDCLPDLPVIDVVEGTYAWTLTVNGAAVNPRNTPTRDADGCGMPAVTIIEAEQPHYEETYAFDDVLSFGLDEFSGQTCE